MQEELSSRIDDLFQRVALEGYDAHRSEVLDVIAACRRQLLSERGILGAWEKELLDYAETRVQADHLRLALLSAARALEVIQLPAEEYGAGLKHARQAWR
jgi:hypothetical protein